MYFALKSIGKDNEEKINNLTSLSDKWQLIDQIAKNDGEVEKYNSLIEKGLYCAVENRVRMFRFILPLRGTKTITAEMSSKRNFPALLKHGYLSLKSKVLLY